jgi:hypothetical protein
MVAQYITAVVRGPAHDHGEGTLARDLAFCAESF